MPIELPLSEKREAPRGQSPKKSKMLLLVLGAMLLLSPLPLLLGSLSNNQVINALEKKPVDYSPICPIVDYYRPASYEQYKDTVLEKIVRDETFRNSSIEKLAGAVRIATETHDEDPETVEEDPEYWEKFGDFEKYLKDTFPVFYSKISLEKVNHHGLLYTWKGSDENLKPLVLMLHQDVVPVPPDTVSRWKYPAFGGHYDGSHLWGRGVADCKNLLIGLLEAAEELINVGFQPKRTVIYSFGFDEEVGGLRNQNADKLLELYGKDSMYAVVDEGGVSLTELGGTYMALPGTGEKGSVNAVIQLTTPGGHSSVPGDHTSIGIMSDLIIDIESSPFDPIFTDANPTFRQYRCMAEHSTEIDSNFKYDIIHSGDDKAANKRVREYIDKDRWLKYYIKTSQAVDVIKGGAKSNALPESVQVVVNHRVAIEQTVEEVLAKVLDNTKKTAKKFDVGVIVKSLEGEETTIIEPTANGYFTFQQTEGLNPAPVTPINDKHWAVFGGNIRHVYEEIAEPDKYKEPIIISPGIATGNTDTRYYWDLTKHIYRYRPGSTPTIETNAHGVNENIPFDSHLQIIAFYFQYIQSVDAVDDSE